MSPQPPAVQVLAEFAAAVSGYPDPASARHGAAEWCAKALGDPPGPSGPEQIALVEGIERILELRLRELETVAELSHRQALLERLSRIQRSITSRAELSQVLDAITEGASDLLAERHAALRLVDAQDPQAMEIVSAVGFDPDLLAILKRGRVGEGAGGRAISERTLVVIEDYEQSCDGIGVMPAGTVQAAMAAPVRESGVVVGSLVVASYVRRRHYSDSERDVLQSLADHASIALTDARQTADITHQAVHDPLTGLPNRTLFHDRVKHALAGAVRRRMQVAVFFLDLDRFKHVNDTHGHAAGDELLVAVAGRLNAALRAGDTVARLGGDEFAVLVEDVGGPEDAIHVAENVAAMFSRPFPIGGREHFVTASIGIALGHRRADRPETLLSNADAAMYRAKDKGRACYELFDEDMRARMTYRLRIETELQRALTGGQLRLQYQPVLSIADRRVVSAEALMRWEHPKRGLLAAGEFIPVAEESGLIVPLGLWALETACADLARWNAARPDMAPLQISVNVSPRQLAQPALARAIADILEASGVPPSTLRLEITERVLLEDAETPRQTLLALRNMGVSLVVDDFGTGYASLAYLRRLPLDGLKVDRSLVEGIVSDPESRAIVGAIAGIARGMNLELTAEGVETEDQLAALAELGYPRAQGFLFARALPAAAFEAYVTTACNAAAASSR